MKLLNSWTFSASHFEINTDVDMGMTPLRRDTVDLDLELDFDPNIYELVTRLSSRQSQHFDVMKLN